MAQHTLSENIGTAAEVIKEVKEAIIEKGMEIPEGTHAIEYPEYIAQMTSKTDLEELAQRVTQIEDSTLWGQPLTKEVNGKLSKVGNIDFSADDTYFIGTDTKRPCVIFARTAIRTGNTNAAGDGKTGVNIFPNGSIGLQVSEKDATEASPGVHFYHQGASNPTSTIKEAATGVLSIPGKICIGNTQKKRTGIHPSGRR
ncbi:MAG: hypothetical protein LUE93_01640 [Bacteroides sp.]|nr:hypothetical protein [Bacteroides sp.]